MEDPHDVSPAGLDTSAPASDPSAPDLDTALGALSTPDPEPVEELEAEIEVIDGLPVVSSARELARPGAVLPAVQTAAAAATGFMVGAATLALLRRRDSRRITRELRDLQGRIGPRRPIEAPTGPGQSYLVHVRVFSRPPQDPRG